MSIDFKKTEVVSEQYRMLRHESEKPVITFVRERKHRFVNKTGGYIAQRVLLIIPVKSVKRAVRLLKKLSRIHNHSEVRITNNRIGPSGRYTFVISKYPPRDSLSIWVESEKGEKLCTGQAWLDMNAHIKRLLRIRR